MADRSTLTVLSLALVALGCGLALTSLAIRRVTTGFKDFANERSLHQNAIPKIGGLVIFPVVAGAVLGKLLIDELWLPPGSLNQMQYPILLWLAGATLIYCICLVNDRSPKELPPATRLIGFFIATCIFVAGLNLAWANQSMEFQRSLAGWLPDLPAVQLPSGESGLILLLIVILLTTIAFTNFYNFMDGLDGLAGSMAVIGFGVMAWAGCTSHADPGRLIAVAAMSVASCSLAFLRWNWPGARIFMGDTGSTFLGFSAAALGWVGSVAAIWHWSFPFLIFFPFWFDASLTLVRRLLRGDKIWQAHREHLYQRAVLGLQGHAMQVRHLRVLLASIVLMLLSGACSLSVHSSWLAGRGVHPMLVMGLLLVHIVAMIWADEQYRKFRLL